MNLKKKKKLIARVLKIGVNRVKLNEEMGDEIKEAITRQDIKNLKREKIIKIKEKKGKKKREKRKTKRKQGSRKKKIRERKKGYVKLTRKLRKYLKKLGMNKKLNREEYYKLRRRIKAREFYDLSHLMKVIKETKK